MKRQNALIALFYVLLHIVDLFPVFAQDTLVGTDGNVRFGHVRYTDVTRHYLIFEENGITHIIALSALNSYTTHAKDDSWKPNEFVKSGFQLSNTPVKSMASSRLLPSREIGKFSAGINFMALSNPDWVGNRDFMGKTYSTNPYLDLFFQIERTKRWALRLPLRIGLNPLSKEVVFLEGDSDYYARYQYMRELIGDIGVEPVFYARPVTKLTWFWSPGIGIGLGRKVMRQQYNLSEPIEAIFTPVGNTRFMRASVNAGFQYFIAQNIQFEMSTGFFLSRNHRWPEDISELGNRRFFGRSLRVALLYRFN